MWRKLLVVTLVLAVAGISKAEVKSVKRAVITSARSADNWTPGSHGVLPEGQAKGDTLYYYTSVDNDAIGLTNGGTYQAAIKLTPTELGQYGGWSVTQVLFYHHESGTHSGQVIVYAAGTDTTPGDILATAPYTATGNGWVVVDLPVPGVMIDPASDLWIAVEVTHAQGEYPISVDAGPAVAGKGDWVYAPGAIPWAELIDYGLNYNWNIAAVVEQAGDSLDPLPPTDLTAYSDYTMPTSMAVSWTDPSHYFGGDTLTDFYIEIWVAGGKDTTFADSVPAGTQADTISGLTDGTLYTILLRAVDANDSASPFVSTTWYAGGSPYPAPPQNLVANVVDESHVELTWINPATQADGTPLDDLAGVNIYVDGSLAYTHPTTAVGMPEVDTIEVVPGSHNIYVTAYDNETPVHESDPSNQVHVVTNVHAGGPDGYGYIFRDSDYPGGPTFNWIDITQVGTPHSLGDDDNVLVQLPAPFPFYGQNLTQLYIVSNGFLSTDNTTEFSNDSLPTDDPVNLIAPFWDDLNPSSGGMIYSYHDTTNNAFIVEWYQVPHYGSGGPYTFEVILYFNTGDILCQYLDLDEGRVNSATIGIQANQGANNYYLLYTYNGNPLEPHDSLALLFTYQTSVGEDNNVGKYMLMGTATNPVRGFSTITFAVPRSGNVNLSLYDIMGRKVKDIFSGRVNAGKHTVRFDATGLAGGVYFVKMVAGDYTGVAKVLVVK